MAKVPPRQAQFFYQKTTFDRNLDQIKTERATRIGDLQIYIKQLNKYFSDMEAEVKAINQEIVKLIIEESNVSGDEAARDSAKKTSKINLENAKKRLSALKEKKEAAFRKVEREREILKGEVERFLEKQKGLLGILGGTQDKLKNNDEREEVRKNVQDCIDETQKLFDAQMSEIKEEEVSQRLNAGLSNIDGEILRLETAIEKVKDEMPEERGRVVKQLESSVSVVGGKKLLEMNEDELSNVLNYIREGEPYIEKLKREHSESMAKETNALLASERGGDGKSFDEINATIAVEERAFKARIDGLTKKENDILSQIEGADSEETLKWITVGLMKEKAALLSDHCLSLTEFARLQSIKQEIEKIKKEQELLSVRMLPQTAKESRLVKAALELEYAHYTVEQVRTLEKKVKELEDLEKSYTESYYAALAKSKTPAEVQKVRQQAIILDALMMKAENSKRRFKEQKDLSTNLYAASAGFSMLAVIGQLFNSIPIVSVAAQPIKISADFLSFATLGAAYKKDPAVSEADKAAVQEYLNYIKKHKMAELSVCMAGVALSALILVVPPLALVGASLIFASNIMAIKTAQAELQGLEHLKKIGVQIPGINHRIEGLRERIVAKKANAVSAGFVVLGVVAVTIAIAFPPAGLAMVAVAAVAGAVSVVSSVFAAFKTYKEKKALQRATEAQHVGENLEKDLNDLTDGITRRRNNSNHLGVLNEQARELQKGREEGASRKAHSDFMPGFEKTHSAESEASSREVSPAAQISKTTQEESGPDRPERK